MQFGEAGQRGQLVVILGLYFMVQEPRTNPVSTEWLRRRQSRVVPDDCRFALPAAWEAADADLRPEQLDQREARNAGSCKLQAGLPRPALVEDGLFDQVEGGALVGVAAH